MQVEVMDLDSTKPSKVVAKSKPDLLPNHIGVVQVCVCVCMLLGLTEERLCLTLCSCVAGLQKEACSSAIPFETRFEPE
jgi:hypothetical protein